MFWALGGVFSNKIISLTFFFLFLHPAILYLFIFYLYCIYSYCKPPSALWEMRSAMTKYIKGHCYAIGRWLGFQIRDFEGGRWKILSLPLVHFMILAGHDHIGLLFLLKDADSWESYPFINSDWKAFFFFFKEHDLVISTRKNQSCPLSSSFLGPQSTARVLLFMSLEIGCLWGYLLLLGKSINKGTGCISMHIGNTGET